jgi:hypothetical protein
MFSQHIYAQYRGQEVEIIDSYWNAGRTALDVHVESVDGSDCFMVHDAVTGAMRWSNWICVPLDSLHQVHLSDDQPVSDLILAEMAGA